MLDADKIDRLNNGQDPNFVTAGLVLDKSKVLALNMWRFYFRLIPIMPTVINQFLLTNVRFKKLRFLPIETLNMVIDVVTSVLTRDYVALGYLRLYIWKIKKVIRRKLFGNSHPKTVDAVADVFAVSHSERSPK
tara:strand:+ start:2816 stop:3217 length:402 start_codon:yes stop_codon:yes gene_type:complete